MRLIWSSIVAEIYKLWFAKGVYVFPQFLRGAQSPPLVFSIAREAVAWQDGYTRALWRNAPFVVVRKLPWRRTVTFSRERVLSEVELCERSWTIAFHARFLLARRVGCFPPCISSWIASTNFVPAQLYRRSVN